MGYRSFIGRRRSILPYTTLCVIVLGVSGCGAPDFSQMTANVWKPSAEVFLVDNPAHWLVSDVETAASAQGIVLKSDSISEAQVASALRTEASRGQAALLVVVADKTVDDAAVSVAAQYPQERFEFITTGIRNAREQNIRYVVPDQSMTGYTLGWLAGQIALVQSTTRIGWLTDGQSESTSTAVKAALAGLYSADPQLNIVPITLSPVSAAGTAIAPGTLGAPSILIVGRSLSQNEASLLHQSGVVTISLCHQPYANSTVAEPMVSNSTVLTSDFKALANRNWSASVTQSSAAPFIEFQMNSLPVNIQTAVNQLQLSLTANRTPAMAGWGLVPPSVQQLWQPFVATGVSTF